MKTTLLITSCILLVIASPIPWDAPILQPRSYNGDSGLSIGIRESGTEALFSLEKQADKNNHRSNQPAGVPTDRKTNFDYSFGTTVDRKDITLELGKPENLPALKPLPSALDFQGTDILEGVARQTHRLYETMIGKIMGDRNQIARVTTFVGDGNMSHLQLKSRPPRIQDMPQLPSPGGEGYRDELLTFIKTSHERLQRAISRRNCELMTLTRVRGFNGTIQNPDPPNVYVAFWKQKQINPSAQIASKPITLQIGENKKGEDITTTIGVPDIMPNIKTLPRGWEKFDTDTLFCIAKQMAEEDQFGESKLLKIIRGVVDDKNKICRAITSLEINKAMKPAPRDITLPRLPVRGAQAEDYRVELLHMIQRSYYTLREAVNHRNTCLRRLDQLQLSHHITTNPDPTNEYVAYWIERHQHPLAGPVSGTDSAVGDSSPRDHTGDAHPTTKKRTRNMHSPEPEATKAIRPSKRPTTASRDPANPNSNGDPESPLSKILREIEKVSPSSSSGQPIIAAGPSTSNHHDHINPVDPVLHTVQTPFEDTSFNFEDWCVIPD